jgi:hypothetical protein
MSSKTCPQAVYATALFKARSSLDRIEDVPRFVSTQRAVLGSVGEKPDGGPVAFPIHTQFSKEVLRQNRVTVFAAFALPDTKRHARRIDVVDLEID